MIHPPHLTLYAIIEATTCGASLVFLVFVFLYSIARVIVHLLEVIPRIGDAAPHTLQSFVRERAGN